MVDFLLLLRNWISLCQRIQFFILCRYVIRGKVRYILKLVFKIHLDSILFYLFFTPYPWIERKIEGAEDSIKGTFLVLRIASGVNGVEGLEGKSLVFYYSIGPSVNFGQLTSIISNESAGVSENCFFILRQISTSGSSRFFI